MSVKLKQAKEQKNNKPLAAPLKDGKDAGNETDERLVEFPLWDGYREYLKSDIADLKNMVPV